MDDGRIVQMYFDRDERAISVTAEKYGRYCTAIAANILSSREDAEECVNDTDWNAWNAIPPHRPKILSAFLGKITRNLAFNRYKRETAAKRGGGELPAVLEELADMVSGQENVEAAFDRKELVAEINRFLSRLPAEKRGIFLCRYWYGESIACVASSCGMTQAAVTMCLARLRSQLHEYLVKRGYDL